MYFISPVGLKWSELIEKHLNPSFDFKKAVEEVLDNRLTFEKVYKQLKVYGKPRLINDFLFKFRCIHLQNNQLNYTTITGLFCLKKK